MEYSLYITCEVHVLYLAHYVYWEMVKRILRIQLFSPLKIILCSLYWHRIRNPVNIRSYSYSSSFWFMIFIYLYKWYDFVFCGFVCVCDFFFSLLSLHIRLNINSARFHEVSIEYIVFHCVSILWFNFLLTGHFDWSRFFSTINNIARMYLAGITCVFTTYLIKGKKQFYSPI